MDARWPHGLRLSQVVALVLLSVALVGCGANEHCFPDGHCIELPSNLGFYARWAGVVLFGGVALLRVFAGGTFFGDESGCSVIVLATAGVVAAWWIYPGTTPPSAHAKTSIKQYEARLERLATEAESAKTQAEARAVEQKRLEATPSYQLKASRDAMAALKVRRDEMQKTRTKWQREFDGLRRELQRMLKQTRAQSHEELIGRDDVPQQTINLLNRAAHLRVLVSGLDHLLASADATLTDLDQQAWKLDKMVELNNVTTEEESLAIRRALANATELVHERTSPVTREDIAAEEARLFRELMGDGS